MSTLAILLAVATPAAVAAEDAAAPSPETSEAEPSKGDYYTRRARTILEAEKAGGQKPHPLTQSYPGMDIVVCEAGCPTGAGPQIVFAKQESVATVAASEGMMLPTSASDDATPGSSLSSAVACIAGCYGGTSSTYAMPEAVGDWSTTIETSLPRDKLSPIR